MSPVKIRAHHLLCLQGFQGYGYSKEFTRNMSHIKDELNQNPTILLKIKTSPDSICKHCPNCSNFKCNADATSEIRIREMDNLVLETLKIIEGQIVSWSKIRSLTSNLSQKNLDKICGVCSWKDKCIYFQSRS